MGYKVGDTVTIREWDDMAEEFGVCGVTENSGFIQTMPHFVCGMKKYCGKTAEILDIIGEYGFSRIRLQFSQRIGDCGWNFCEDMFTEHKSECMKNLESHAAESDIEGFLLST